MITAQRVIRRGQEAREGMGRGDEGIRVLWTLVGTLYFILTAMEASGRF